MLSSLKTYIVQIWKGAELVVVELEVLKTREFYDVVGNAVEEVV